ncbi:hypothetical protein ACWC2K_13535 [Streptomyces chattanoogensis]
MPFRSRIHPTSPAPPWRSRLLALVLGGLLLIAFDCAPLLHGPRHAHGAAPSVSATALPQAPGASAAGDSCPALGHDAGPGNRQPAPAPAGAAAPAVPTPVPAVAGTSGTAVLPGLRTRALSGRATLTALCRWRT